MHFQKILAGLDPFEQSSRGVEFVECYEDWPSPEDEEGIKGRKAEREAKESEPHGAVAMADRTQGGSASSRREKANTATSKRKRRKKSDFDDSAS